MATARVLNYTLDATGLHWSVIWKLTRVMKKAGWAHLASTDGVSKSVTPSNDLWGNNVDALADTFPGLTTVACWAVYEGPATVKIGIGAASVGTFLRGEIVTQATSGATGEILGYVINAAGNSGWLVIMPQTGTFDGSHVITGNTSGATVTATSYTRFRRQIVFAKTTLHYQGWIFYQCVTDAEATNTVLFSGLAANASRCTATVAPGNSAAGGDGSNRFPALAMCLTGAAEGAASAWWGDQGDTYGKAQIVAVNPTPGAGVSADGTFWIAVYNVTRTIYYVKGLFRLDDTEPGDVEPFAWFAPCLSTEHLLNVTTGRTQNTPLSGGMSWGQWAGSNGSYAPWKTWCGRGLGDAWDSYIPCASGWVTVYSDSTIAQVGNSGGVCAIRNHPDRATTPPKPFEPVYLFSTAGNNLTMRKGAARWYGLVPTGTVGGTYDNKVWLCQWTPSAGFPTPVVGPMDGATTIVTT